MVSSTNWSAMEPLKDILKQDVFNLEGLVGLMAVRQATENWLAVQTGGDQVRVLAVKPAGRGCKVKLGVTHSTQMQQWYPSLKILQQHLNTISNQTGWPVMEVRLVMMT